MSIDKSFLGHGEQRTAILNLQNQYIEEIDTIPMKYKRVHTLVLNNNHLKNLRGVEQFARIKKLDVADNEVLKTLEIMFQNLSLAGRYFKCVLSRCTTTIRRS